MSDDLNVTPDRMFAELPWALRLIETYSSDLVWPDYFDARLEGLSAGEVASRLASLASMTARVAAVIADLPAQAVPDEPRVSRRYLLDCAEEAARQAIADWQEHDGPPPFMAGLSDPSESHDPDDGQSPS